MQAAYRERHGSASGAVLSNRISACASSSCPGGTSARGRIVKLTKPRPPRLGSLTGRTPTFVLQLAGLLQIPPAVDPMRSEVREERPGGECGGRIGCRVSGDDREDVPSLSDVVAGEVDRRGGAGGVNWLPSSVVEYRRLPAGVTLSSPSTRNGLDTGTLGIVTGATGDDGVLACPRHGTTRTLSVLSMAIQMVSHPRCRERPTANCVRSRLGACAIGRRWSGRRLAFRCRSRRPRSAAPAFLRARACVPSCGCGRGDGLRIDEPPRSVDAILRGLRVVRSPRRAAA